VTGIGRAGEPGRRGGDIDLYIQVQLPPREAVRRRLGMLAELSRRLGERKVDLVLDLGGDALPIHRHARETGVKL